MASFVARERELKLLEQALDDALLTDGRLVTISGEPGIGKTRLSEELAARAVQRGFVAAFGRTWEGEGTPAYFPWLQALRVLARSLGARFEHARAQAPELSSLFDAKLGASAAVDPSEARFRLFDALTELLRQLSAETPLLVVLEDLHAADQSTLELLHFIMLFLTQRIGFLYTRADDAGWAEHEPKALALLGKDPLFQVFRCTFDAACGRSELVRESLGIARQVPLHTLPDAAGLATACAVAGVTEHAQAFYDFLAQESRKGPWQFGPGRVTSMGPRALTLGRLALLLGREDDARAHFEAALALAKRVRSRPYVAQSELELARLLAKSDPARARERAETARSIAAEVGMGRVEARAQALLGELHQPSHAPPAKAPTKDVVLERNGETWRIDGLGRSLLLKDAKGLFYLDQLVRAPCREIHVLTLAGARDEGDAGPLLDERAKRQYRARAEALRAELAEAENHADPGRVARAQSELSALTRELSRAFGLGDRERRGVSPTERARINVQRRVRDAIARVSAVDAELGQHLDLSVRTGLFCVYLPT